MFMVLEVALVARPIKINPVICATGKIDGEEI
jgi:hypothetical protein